MTGHGRPEYPPLQPSSAEVNEYPDDAKLLGWTKDTSETQIYIMTLTHACNHREQLDAMGKFDWIVFDEGSQVSLLQFLLLRPMAKRSISFGDHKQLAPISKGSSIANRALQGDSVYGVPESIDAPWLHPITEQSRMHPDIAEISNEIHYGGDLKTSELVLNDPKWLEMRNFSFGTTGQDEHVVILPTQNTKCPKGQKYRTASAQAIIDKILSADSKWRLPGLMLILTPYRSQVSVFESLIVQYGLKGVRVKTVHRVQGMEAHIVFFDPVNASSEFLTQEGGNRLINVAVTRATSKVFIAASLQDLEHKMIRKAYDIWHCTRQVGARTEAKSTPPAIWMAQDAVAI
jgi:superfamily I DNA and/or RNA helicase